MASLRDIKRKIRVVKNIAQITQAMKMVAAAKLRRVQERVEKGKPYANTMAELVGTLAPNVREVNDPLLAQREVGAVGIIVIAADKGLCGSYNSNILRISQNFIDKKIAEMRGNAHTGDRQPVRILTIGKKATDFFTKREYPVVGNFPSIGVDSPYDEVRGAAKAITAMFLSGQVDEVYVAYTEFVNTITQRPQVIKFLPIEPPSAEEAGSAQVERTETGNTVVRAEDGKGGTREFLFEPGASQLLAVLLPRFVETRVYQLLMEAVASEFGARMTAMTNATKNAGDQIEQLTLIANRTRQAGITKEILEIVGGAEALRG